MLEYSSNQRGAVVDKTAETELPPLRTWITAGQAVMAGSAVAGGWLKYADFNTVASLVFAVGCYGLAVLSVFDSERSQAGKMAC
ncbi:hypothetical protein A3F55_00710 [Candidatus Adlerbacteria bacterium RIFCSPHIGHO2_12_FULL_53_18]|uniref:Uncharacterized protein n=1 Tax=Candidatus Adlerbacteria bacterium RIFCSPHIGHO2_12_FULL_53_18 TaxID=1797242 RepID=A0A1F4XU67_9BACT|nr:MAG: hypothetical protein A3F55_00710 [Candidatus Adlerbacteria bacterium RIFCSPHIGHO2_12_FULL_53_18]